MVTKGEKPRADASSESDGSRSGSGHEVGRFPGSPAGVEEGSPKRCVSEGSLDAEDLERGALSEIDQKRGGGGGGEKPDKGKPSKAAAERDCRICHLGLESASPESGLAIELGCSCKDDLGAAHRQCAETWFKIRGNKTCEICGTIARNVVGSGFGMAEKEMEYRVDLFNRLTKICFDKCIDKRYKESELNMGENSCIDRCVSKYWQASY
uniref:RING-CH-type domain-containing protein n=1 Tax=Ananas comosus var. bracteatus TaxID=296719 RepID=A0A6V7NGH7_ANACO|nr:unnamed protein product [Ananas comosus var. bracteatus]